VTRLFWENRPKFFKTSGVVLLHAFFTQFILMKIFVDFRQHFLNLLPSSGKFFKTISQNFANLVTLLQVQLFTCLASAICFSVVSLSLACHLFVLVLKAKLNLFDNVQLVFSTAAD
jgi:hypothetical protein